MLARNVLYYGHEEPLPRQIPLRAGPLTLLYEDGDLRYIKLKGHEIIRRIYVAVRDQNWATILPVFSNINIDTGPDYFHISFDVENKLNDVHFSWRGAISGEPGDSSSLARISYSMEGQARTTFYKNRIGFCVLYPAGAAGLPCGIEHIDGTREISAFFTTVNPDQPPLPFTDIAAMSHEVFPGVQGEVRFSGDTFEMEDQRNWTDASYKVFSTPLRLPYPVEIRSGTTVTQSVKLTLRGKPPPIRRSKPEPGLMLRVEPDVTFKLPEIGVGAASHGRGLSQLEIDRLKLLHLAHLRIDLHLDDPSYPEALRRGIQDSSRLGTPLYLAVYIPGSSSDEWVRLRKLVDELQPNVALWLIYPPREVYLGGSPTREAVELACQHLSGPFAAGTDTDFIFLQRTPPPLDKLAAVCLAINPQVHAFDNLSLVETLEGQVSVVETAHRLAGGKPVIVSPVTLKPRHNPYTSGAIPPVPAGGLPPQVDPRQLSLFATGWTLGSIRSMAVGGAKAVTYYETTGWRGLMETRAGSLLPELFPSTPGMVFPLYHILADIAEFRDADVLGINTGDDLRFIYLAFHQQSHTCLLVANFTPEVQTVKLVNLPLLRSVRCLDENTALLAMNHPEVYRAQQLQPFQGNTLTLLPFAVARLDS